MNSLTSINDNELADSIIINGIDVLFYADRDKITDLDRYTKKIIEENLNYPIPKSIQNGIEWFIPSEYKNMDIEEYLINLCPKENYQRLIEELDLYKKHDMIIVLKSMKYLVDTMKKYDIVWGVGRGSSVASYVLFLLGVHRIDSVKYCLSINEFFKGE